MQRDRAAIAGRFGSSAQAGTERFEFGVGDNASLVQFREFPEPLGRVGPGRVAAARRRPLGVRCCLRERLSNRLLGPAPALTVSEPRVDGIGSSRDRDGADHPAEERHWRRP
jgi:hypothetical protein